MDVVSHVEDSGAWTLLSEKDMEQLVKSTSGVRVDWIHEISMPLARTAAGFGDRQLHVKAAWVLDHPVKDDYRVYLLVNERVKDRKYGWLHVVSSSDRAVCTPKQ